MATNRYMSPLRIERQPEFFELPYNEMAAAVSARQQRYDVMQEGLSKAMAEANALKAMPGADTDYISNIQNKLKELEVNYIDQDLAGPAGSQLLKEIRTTALDPGITKIQESYENWKKAQELRGELKKAQQYNPYLAEDSREASHSTIQGDGSYSVYNFQPAAFNPQDEKSYFDNIQGTKQFDAETKQYIDVISEQDIRDRSRAMASFFLASPDGANKLTIEKQTIDENTESYMFPGKTYRKLTDEEWAADHLTRSGDEFLKLREGPFVNKYPKSGTDKKPTYESLFGTGYGVGTDIVKGEVIGSDPFANQLKRDQLSQNIDLKLNAQNGENSPRWALSSSAEFKGAEANSALAKHDIKITSVNGNYTWVPTLKEGITLTDKEKEAWEDAWNRTEVARNNHVLSIKQDEAIRRDLDEYDLKLRDKYGISRDYKFNDPKFVSIVEEAKEAYKTKARETFLSSNKGLFNSLGGSFEALVLGMIPQGQDPIAFLSSPEVFSQLSEELANDTTGILPKYTAEELKTKLQPAITKALEEGSKAENDVYFRQVPEYAKLWNAYKEAYRINAEVPVQAMGMGFTFDSSPEGKRAKETLEEAVPGILKTQAFEVYDAQSNKMVTDEEVKKAITDGYIKILTWRIDENAILDGSGGIVLDVSITKPAEGGKPGETLKGIYEIRNVVGVSQYLEAAGAEKEALIADHSLMLNKGFDRSGGWISRDFNMGEGMPKVDVEKVLTDEAGFKRGSYKFTDPKDPTKIYYANNYKEVMQNYWTMANDKYGKELYSSTVNEWRSREGIEAKEPKWVNKADIIAKIPTVKSDIDPHPEVSDKLIAALLDIEPVRDGDKVNINSENETTGALGPFQILPSTALDPGSGIQSPNPVNIEESIRFAKNYLNKYAREYGNLTNAIIAYHDGPGNAKLFMQGKRQLGAEMKLYLEKLKSAGFPIKTF